MLTPVERVLVLKGADLLKDVGPRHLLALANVAREIEIFEGDQIYGEEDPADALYIVVDGRVLLRTGDRKMSEVGPGEAFGTWSLVDDSARGHRAECIQDGLALALHRDEFYDIAAGDLTLLQELVRVLAKRLRALVADKPEEARVEGEGVEKPEAIVETEAASEAAAAASEAAAEASEAAAAEPAPGPGEALKPATPVEPAAPAAPAAPAPSPGEALKAAALGKPVPDADAETTDEPPEPAVPSDEVVTTAEIEPLAPLGEPPVVPSSAAAPTKDDQRDS